MIKITFTQPIKIVQDGLKAMALFCYAKKIEFDGAIAKFEGNSIHQSFIEGIEG